jgi:hypothetical protein
MYRMVRVIVPGTTRAGRNSGIRNEEFIYFKSMSILLEVGGRSARMNLSKNITQYSKQRRPLYTPDHGILYIHYTNTF